MGADDLAGGLGGFGVREVGAGETQGGVDGEGGEARSGGCGGGGRRVGGRGGGGGKGEGGGEKEERGARGGRWWWGRSGCVRESDTRLPWR